MLHMPTSGEMSILSFQTQKTLEIKDFRYMKIHIFALRWKDEIKGSSQLRTLLKRVVMKILDI